MTNKSYNYKYCVYKSMDPQGKFGSQGSSRKQKAHSKGLTEDGLRNKSL